jgi:hypothetical protein
MGILTFKEEWEKLLKIIPDDCNTSANQPFEKILKRSGFQTQNCHRFKNGIFLYLA